MLSRSPKSKIANTSRCVCVNFGKIAIITCYTLNYTFMKNHERKNCFPDMDEWEMCYLNIAIEVERKITMPECKSFMGLYLNLGCSHQYNVKDLLPNTIPCGRYNLIYMPEAAAELTLTKGVYAVLCIEFSTDILLRLAHEYPMLQTLLKRSNLKIPFIVSNVNMVITPEMNDAIRDILSNKIGKVSKHARVISILGNALTNMKAMGLARLKEKDVDMVVDVCKYLNKHLNGIFSVDQLADMVDVSRRKLERTFRVVYRKSVIRFFLDEKLKRAATLLRDTNLSATQISGMVGYKNMSRFSEAFKKYYSCSPIEFRKLSAQ
jgi:AraC-like DNA-binding protein